MRQWLSLHALVDRHLRVHGIPEVPADYAGQILCVVALLQALFVEMVPLQEDRPVEV